MPSLVFYPLTGTWFLIGTKRRSGNSLLLDVRCLLWCRKKEEKRKKNIKTLFSENLIKTRLILWLRKVAWKKLGPVLQLLTVSHLVESTNLSCRYKIGQQFGRTKCAIIGKTKIIDSGYYSLWTIAQVSKQLQVMATLRHLGNFVSSQSPTHFPAGFIFWWLVRDHRLSRDVVSTWPLARGHLIWPPGHLILDSTGVDWGPKFKGLI